MSKDKIFDFDNELETTKRYINEITDEVNQLSKSNDSQVDKLERLEEEIRRLSENLNYNLKGEEKKSTKEHNELDFESLLFLNNNPIILETKVREEVFKNPNLLPNLNNLDRSIILLASVLAVVVDFLIVKIPKDIVYLNKYQQEGSSVTKFLRSLGIDDNGNLQPSLAWLEKNCKVPFDQSTNKDIKGFYPRSHRLHSLGHDPLFGILFGILDILLGNMTTIDKGGNLLVTKISEETDISDKIFAPLVWIGHIISDICTNMGIPIPGWGLTQILQFGSFGRKERTIADISRWMYLNGYDIRHFITMSIPVAVIEIVIRAYHYLSNLTSPSELEYSIKNSVVSREVGRIETNLKLHKMLFLAHLLSTSGNVIKVISYQGNPLAINLPQWLILIKESIVMFDALNRDKITEKVLRNRRIINEEWEEISQIKFGQANFLKIDSSVYYEHFRYLTSVKSEGE